MDLNQMIDVSKKFEVSQQQASLEQDNTNKTAFALAMLDRMPREPAAPQEPPKIPSLGALAIPS